MWAASRLSRRVARRASRRQIRRGAVIVLTAFVMIVMLAFLAFTVDLGYIMNARSELQRATDSAALAGAGALVEGTDAAQLQALDFMLRNPVGGQVLLEQENREALLEAWLAEHPDEFEVELGQWDPDTRQFAETADLPSTIHVTAQRTGMPLFFAKAFGINNFDIQAESIARYQPRDIMLVLDFSASMNDDSELKRIYDFGSSSRTAVETSLAEIYEDLGSPTYGNMQFEPQYISSNYSSTIKSTLGLTHVAYPYASGSWDDYISYVKSSSYVNAAGYRKKYGYLTWINYLLEKKPGHNQTADLWMVRAQPITAVKESSDVFMDYIQEVDCQDRVGLAIYNSASQEAVLEESLTEDFASVQDVIEHRQAGHYDRFTNIGAGIREARLELRAVADGGHARTGAFKMIVLMTDGNANRPSSESQGRAYALDQADLAAEQGLPIVTISLGCSADTDLMQEIADRTGGVHFNIPGGQEVTDFEDDLRAVFRRIADDRPLVLVK